MKSAIEAKEETIEELMKEIVKFRVQIEQLNRTAISQRQINEVINSPKNINQPLSEERYEEPEPV